MLKDKITEFFVFIDDFCIDFELEIQKHLLESSTNKSRKGPPPLLIPRS
ncbi:hypothetical protein J2X69_005067 [Algoriphagus sp. 4150]|nr:hypothetical protein [Algoriphagus sp. 4150]